MAGCADLPVPYVREWLEHQAVHGNVEHEPATQRSSLPPAVAADLPRTHGGSQGRVPASRRRWAGRLGRFLGRPEARRHLRYAAALLRREGTDHLRRSVRRSSWCSYRSSEPVRWTR